MDVSNLAQPVEVGKLHLDDMPEWGVHVAVSENYVYIAGDNRLAIVDVSNPAAPREEFTYDTEHAIAGMAVAGDCVYVAQGAGGLAILCD